jgi:hypothetical protein
VNHTELISAFRVAALRSRNEAAQKRADAAQQAADTKSYVNQHVGEAMADQRRMLEAIGKDAVDRLNAEAARLDERASTFEAGFLLDSDQEFRDPTRRVEPMASLICAAYKFGLVVPNPVRPSAWEAGNPASYRLDAGPVVSQG